MALLKHIKNKISFLFQNKLSQGLLEKNSSLNDDPEILKKLNFSLNSANFGAWFLDLKTKTAWRSENHDKIFGYQENLTQWTHDVFMSHVITEDREKVESEFASAFSKRFSKIECRIKRASDQAIRWLEIQSNTFYDSKNNPIEMAGLVRDITEEKFISLESKRVEEKLKNKQKEFQTLLQFAPIGLFITDQNGKCIFVNKQWSNITGLTYDQAKGHGWVKAIYPEDNASVFDKWNESTLSQSPFSMEFRFQRPNGDVRWVLSKAITIKNESNQVIEYLGSIQDITDIKLKESELQKASQKLQLIIESSPAGIFVLNEKLKLTVWNKACEKIFGWSKAEALGKFVPYATEEMLQESLKMIEQVHHAKEPINFECERPRKDGSMIKIECAATPILGKNNEIQGLISITQDITEKDLLQKKLLETNKELQITLNQVSEERSRALKAAEEAESLKRRLSIAIESSKIGVWEWDIVHNNLIWDNRMYQLYGISPNSFSSAYEAWLNGVHPDDQAKSNEEIQQALRGTKEFDTQFRVMLPDKSVKYIRALGEVQRDQSGNPIKMIGLNWDISKEKQAEQELEKAREDAIRASQAKSEFLANMSHEIRTPINGIMGMTELLLGTPLNKEQKEYAENTQKSVGTLLYVINDILDFSKIEAGRLDLESIDFDLKKVIEDTVSVLSFSAKQKNLSLKTEGLKDWQKRFRGDPGRITQVLTNLTINAIKFTEKGTVLVRILEIDSNASSARFRFEVIDEGIGISETVKEKLFQAFSQADSSTARRYGGTGLGLSICKRLVEAMGGTIGFSSNEGVGSTFWFELELFKEVESNKINKIKDNNERESKIFSVVKSQMNKKTQRVLIAEDNEVNQKYATKMLEKLGYHFDTVANGKEALKALRENKYDIILMDCQMPELDGYETTKIIRSGGDVYDKNTIIIALTANALAEDREKCLAVGMNDYLAKPFKLESLEEILSLWTAKKRNLKHTEILDPKVLTNLKSLDSPGKTPVIEELGNIFINLFPKQLEQVKDNLKKKNFKFIKDQAHQWKSASASLGATKFSKLCKQLEMLEKKGLLHKADELIKDLENEFQMVREALLEQMNLVA